MEQIRLDLIPGKSAPVCHASQYDVGRTIRLNLVEGGSEYSIPSGTTAEIHIRKPDNNIISAAVTATQGNKYIDIVTAEQWTACAGTNLCEIVLTNGGNVIGTINFILEVEMDPIDGGSASESVIYNIQALVDTALANSSLVNLPIHLVEGTTTDADLAQALRDAFANNQDVLGYASISGTTTAIYCRSTSASTDAFMAIHYLLTGVLDDKVYTFEVVVGASGDQIDVSKTVEEKGKFTIHIVESTMSESAADILAALSDGKELQVIYKPDANNLTTHILPLTLDSGARPDGIRVLAFASLWGSKLYAADIALDSVHSTVASLSMTNGKDLGDFPIHINNSTITETAGKVLDAMADGLRPYVIWTNNSQSNYTFTYGLAAVWNPDATTETLIFACPITGAVRTIHIFINPTTRTYSSSIQIIDYNIPQINDSSTSSASVWSSQKTASELADKAEIDDDAVSSSTAWSSERIVSLLPTESASGAVASFETPLTLPLVSHSVTIEPVQAGTGDPSPINKRPIIGRNEVNVTRTGANLFNWATKENGYRVVWLTGEDYADASAIRSDYIPVKQGTNISTSTDVYMLGYDKNKSYLGVYNSGIRNFVKSTNGSTARLFEIPSGCCFVKFLTFDPLTAISDTFMANFGTTATTYEPYKETISLTIALGQTVYGGELDVTNGVLRVTYGYYDFANKNTPWDSGAPNEAGFIRFVRTLTDKKNGYSIICDKFKTRIGIVPSDPTEEAISGYANNNSVYIAVSTSRLSGDLTTSAGRRQAFNDWIDANGLTICYELATPIEITLTPTELSTLYGVNNFWADTGDTSVEFKQDIQTYIDNRLSSGTRSLSLAKVPVETEETKQEEQEGDESLTR